MVDGSTGRGKKGKFVVIQHFGRGFGRQFSLYDFIFSQDRRQVRNPFLARCLVYTLPLKEKFPRLYALASNLLATKVIHLQKALLIWCLMEGA